MDEELFGRLWPSMWAEYLLQGWLGRLTVRILHVTPGVYP
jgi:hypothetical protein